MANSELKEDDWNVRSSDVSYRQSPRGRFSILIAMSSQDQEVLMSRIAERPRAADKASAAVLDALRELRDKKTLGWIKTRDRTDCVQVDVPSDLIEQFSTLAKQSGTSMSRLVCEVFERWTLPSAQKFPTIRGKTGMLTRPSPPGFWEYVAKGEKVCRSMKGAQVKRLQIQISPKVLGSVKKILKFNSAPMRYLVIGVIQDLIEVSDGVRKIQVGDST
jgi:hypothetical protein